MLRFYKVQKPPSKAIVQQTLDSVKTLDFQTFASQTHVKSSEALGIDGLNGALLWCKSAHKMFDVDAPKLDTISKIQQELESLAAQGSHKDVSKLRSALNSLAKLGYEPSEVNEHGDLKEAYEDYLDHIYDQKASLRRSMRLAYATRSMNL